jgi:alanyl aminopeptidase
MTSLAQGSGKPEIVPAFETFLNQPGVPLVRIKSACQGRDLTVELTQTPFGTKDVQDNRLWSVPVCMRDIAKGRPLGCTMLTSRSATATFENQCGAIVMPNASGAGYYRFSMDVEEWRKLAARSGKLPPAEQLVLLHSLRAAFRAGDADAPTYVAAVQAVAAAAPWDVLDTIQKLMAEMRGDLLARADVPAFEQKARAIFAPLLGKIGLEPKRGERPATALLRAKLAEIAVKVAREPSTMSALAATGAAQLRAVAKAESEGALAPPAELLPVALWAALFTGGEPVARDAMAAIKVSSEAEFRLAAIVALTAARDAKAVAEIEEFVAAGALRVREARFYLRDVFTDAERRNGAWAWLRKDFKRLIDPVPKENHGRLVGLPSTLCTDTAHAEIEWYFKPMVDKLMGAPRIFANTLEAVDRCVAWRKAKSAELASAWRALP